MARGRDVSLRTRVDTAQRITVVLETTDGPQRQRPLRPVLTVSRTRCCNLPRPRSPSTSREPTITKVAKLILWCWRCRRGIQEDVIYHKVSLERTRDRATAKKPVVTEKYRRNHSQGASGENPRQNHSTRASGEKKLKEQHGYEDIGYEDSDKNIEATMRSQSSAQRREGEKRRKEPKRAEPTAGKANQRATTETKRITRRITKRNTVQKKAAVSQSRSI